MTKLKRVASLHAGGTPTVDDPNNWSAEGDQGTPWVSIGDMSDGETVMSTARMLSDAGIRSKRLPVAPSGTLLFAMYASVGAVAELGVQATWNQALLGIVPRPGAAESRFVRYWLEHLRADLGALVRSNTQDNLNADQVGNFPFPLMAIPRQQAIADYLDTETARIDALIEKKKRMVELLKERVDSSVFTGITGRLTSPCSELRPSGVEWIGALPTHYGLPTLGRHYRSLLGKMLNAAAASGPWQTPYLKNTNVRWDGFEVDDLPTMSFDEDDRLRLALRPGDLLVCEGGEVGRAAVWNAEDSGIFFQKALHRVRPIDAGNTRFLMYCLWAAAKLDVFAIEGNQATIVHLTGEKLMEHRFPFPPLQEQAVIVNLLDDIRESDIAMRNLIERQLESFREHRQALITAAVTGELAIPGVAA